MKLSQQSLRSLQNTSKEYDSISHELLIRGGFLDMVASGIYTFMPAGVLTLTKIEHIVRKHMLKLGALEVIMPNLHPKELWTQSGRWDSVDVLYKLKSRYGNKEYGLGLSHEEIVTPLAHQFIQSYKNLPLALFQINTKFRDEARAKSGILRGREFRMKDMYSFHRTPEDLEKYYEKVKKTYLDIFTELGLPQTKVSEASGGDFTEKFSHEFNVPTPAGEVDLIYCESCTFAKNTEVLDKKLSRCPLCGEKLTQSKAIEVGNIFDLGTKFSNSFDLKYNDEDGKQRSILMGCYGIGTSRLIGAIVESHHDEKGIIWPESVTPYHAHIVQLGDTKSFSDLIYRSLVAEGLDVLLDDRDDIMAGEKFAVADLIGIPLRLVISDRTNGKIEVKLREEESTRLFTPSELINRLKDYYTK